MRVLMKRSPRPGYLQSMNGQPMSLEQLALATGCPTAEVPALIDELFRAGVLRHSDKEGYFSPRMVQYQAFRQKCAKAGRRGGGNPKLRQSTFKGRPKGSAKRCPKGSLPDGSPPPVTPSPSLPPPGNQEEAEARARSDAARLAAAREFAEDWIAEHVPQHKASVRAFAKLVALLGRDLAVEEVLTVAKDATVKNPLAVAWSNHDPNRRGRAGNGNGQCAAPKTYDQVAREQQEAAANAAFTEVISAS
jgi:hypothetical protein